MYKSDIEKLRWHGGELCLGEQVLARIYKDIPPKGGTQSYDCYDSNMSLIGCCGGFKKAKEITKAWVIKQRVKND